MNSSVLKWPDAAAVHRAALHWAEREAPRRNGLLRLGYFGSYARGEWGVGSDLDLIAIVEHTDTPFERRALEWDLSGLPVPAELLVYTRAEWEEMRGRGARFPSVVEAEAVWLLGSR